MYAFQMPTQIQSSKDIMYAFQMPTQIQSSMDIMYAFQMPTQIQSSMDIRPNYNGRSSDESPDISTHCPSTCRADLTKWPDENAPVALAVVKRDPKKSQANAK